MSVFQFSKWKYSCPGLESLPFCSLCAVPGRGAILFFSRIPTRAFRLTGRDWPLVKCRAPRIFETQFSAEKVEAFCFASLRDCGTSPDLYPHPVPLLSVLLQTACLTADKMLWPGGTKYSRTQRAPNNSRPRRTPVLVTISLPVISGRWAAAELRGGEGGSRHGYCSCAPEHLGDTEWWDSCMSHVLFFWNIFSL